MLTVREISESEHLAYLNTQPSASFLQTPAWAHVKNEWRRESLGWFQDGAIVGTALVLYRQLPRVKRYLAYLPEGPVIDWSSDDLAAWLDPLTAHLKKKGAFGVRMGPPVETRRWTAAQVKEGIADEAVSRLGQIPPEHREALGARVVAQLSELGWREQVTEGGFAAGQPKHVFQVPLADADGPLAEEQLLKAMNQQWRRNIKKAAKLGVEVSTSSTTEETGTTVGETGPTTGETTSATGDTTPATRVSDEDLKAFHDLYVHTAERDHFTPRPLGYFRTMVNALSGEDPDRIKLWFARHEGDLVAATIAIRVGTHAWYSYGASSTEKRDVRGSNAIQWAMMCDALAAGATVYDLRGITDTLDSDDSHVGLIQFKVGTGGHAVEYAGEWDLPLNRALYKAFDVYMKRR